MVCSVILIQKMKEKLRIGDGEKHYGNRKDLTKNEMYYIIFTKFSDHIKGQIIFPRHIKKLFSCRFLKQLLK